MFSPSEPADQEIQQHYSKDYFEGGAVEYDDYIGAESTHRAQAQHYLAAIRRFGRIPCSILDVGCAAGFFLDEARKRGCTVVGCDVSAYAISYARTALELEVMQGDFRELELSGKEFDVVTAFNSFEHLPQPRVVADLLKRLVRPGGLLMIETWDYRSLAARALGSHWHQWHPPFVPYYYTYPTLLELFPLGDWEPVSHAGGAKLISAGRALGILAGNRAPTALRSLLSRLAAGPLSRVHLSYRLGDLKLVVFRRR